MTTGTLLLHGSSGRPDVDRVRILEAEGYDVVAPRGGSDEADRAFGARTWPNVLRVLTG
ncbi:hypothetical protein GCM10009744_21010 [Kribbella alba]|uniref:Alpha/beta hydrolase n=1 Tax=Kribbella alba TaxID=190197 RepID=A0ABN2F647_9ACTN